MTLSAVIDALTPTIRVGMVVFYVLNVIAVSVFGVHSLWLAWVYLKVRRAQTGGAADPGLVCGADGTLPTVTVQLPLFNEDAVAARVITAACELDWPRDRLEVQVLDDSTDASARAVVDGAVEALRAEGHRVVLLRRGNREGFKAGALSAGLETARGEFAAVFDADFVPAPDFLRRLMPQFQDPSVGMVQGRWGHLNEDQNLLTMCQSRFLDGHFAVEQVARSRSGWFFNFNGTAGIWRRACIADAGGWTQRTLTEDLDLSYRAQLRGWRFVYDPDTVAPAELPPTMKPFKVQQRRWNKGTIEVCRILLGEVWRAPLPLDVKAEATVHLCKPLLHLWVVLMAVLSFPASMIAPVPMGESVTWILITILVWIVATCASGVFYVVASWGLGKSPWKTALLLPGMVALGVGTSLSNAWAVGEALVGQRSDFVRTPKFGALGGAGGGRPEAERRRRRRHLLERLEIIIAVYLVLCLGGAVHGGEVGGLPFLFLFTAGFIWSAFGDRWPFVRRDRLALAAG
ncbi:MAG: glycosyltransferase [Phycisphaerales bacterium]|nr:glycosyltransferase [Phycisphaerales bacterium]